MTRRRFDRVSVATGAVALALLAGCMPVADAPESPAASQRAPKTSTAPETPAASDGVADLAKKAEQKAAEPKKSGAPKEDGSSALLVVGVSVDALNPVALSARVVGSRGFRRLITAGATTLNARSVVEQTETLPNHISMVTGRPIDRAAGGHGISVNTPTSGRVSDFAGAYVASVFDVLHDEGRPTAMFASKPKFKMFDVTWSDGAPDTTPPDHGRDKIDVFTFIRDDEALERAALSYLADASSGFCFIHLSAVDAAGHKHGWLSAPYLQAVAQTDGRIAQLADFVDQRNASGRPTVLIVTADHGGPEGKHGHAQPQLAADYTVPFMAYGAGVPSGADLYGLNPTRRDPGTRRISYQGAQPIRNADLANAVTSLFGLGTVPGSRIGTSPPLVVREGVGR